MAELWDTFICLDTETGGTNPAVNQILTLDATAVRLQGGQLHAIGQAFHGEFAIDPGLQLEPRALAVNGIDPQTWSGQRGALVLRGFQEWVRQTCGQGYVIPMGYNVGFDLEMLKAEYLRHPGGGRYTDSLSYRSVDVLQLAVLAVALGFLPATKSLKLVDVCALLGIPTEGAHSSAVDVRLTLDAFNALTKRMGLSAGLSSGKVKEGPADLPQLEMGLE